MARPRRRRPTSPRPRPVLADPRSLRAKMYEYLDWLRPQNYAERTIENREAYLGYFVDWCEQRSLLRPGEITKPILERYQRHLFHYRKRDGRPLSFRSQYTHLVPVRAFFKWLAKKNHILYNPASELDLPRLEKRLPRYVLTAREAELVLSQASPPDPVAVRDRAILETFYSTGIRRMELVNLDLFNLDTERGTLFIRQGKGRKDRLVPIGDRAVAWIMRYVSEVRPGWVIEPDEGALFLTSWGERFTRNRLTQLVRGYVKAADLGKSGACHLFRHTMATLLLENGADLHVIQRMLGHEDVSTTQIYAQMSIRQLKEIHTRLHPARMERVREVGQEASVGEDLAAGAGGAGGAGVMAGPA